MPGGPITITTTTGFGISTAAGPAFTLNNSGLSFTDNYGSTITGTTYGLFSRNYGGVLSFTTTGVVTGTTADGINTSSYGTGITINAVTVTGDDYGISARNLAYDALAYYDDRNRFRQQ